MVSSGAIPSSPTRIRSRLFPESDGSNGKTESNSMIDPDLLAILRCPADGSQLELIPTHQVDQINRQIRDGQARDVADQRVTTPIEGGLRSAGQQVVYPIRDRIPTLVIEEAIRVELT